MGDDSNEPAVPVSDCAAYQCHGMTLRDYFAGQFVSVSFGPAGSTMEPEAFAACCYIFADAMLAARQKGQTDD